MEFVLLTLAIGSLALQASALHVILFVVHGIAGTYLAARLVSRQPLTAMFIGIYLIMYFPNPIAVMTGLIPETQSERPEILYPSNALLLIGLDLFMIGARYFRRTNKDIGRMPRLWLSHFRVELCIAIGLIVAAVGSAVLMVVLAGMGIDIFRVSKHVIHGFGEHNTYYMITTYAFLTVPLSVFLIGLKRPALQFPYLLPVGVLMSFHFMVLRVRSPFIAVIFAYLVAMVARRFLVTLGPQPTRKPFSGLFKLAMILGPVLLVLAAVGIKFGRHMYMARDYRLNAARLEEFAVETFAVGDLGHSYFLRRALEIYPEQMPYLNGQSYYRLLFVPIPRSLWPEKPENTQRIFARALKIGKGNTTIPAGIVGDTYINFGPFGVLIMLLWGLLFAQERYQRLTSLILLAGSPWWMAHIVRGGLTVPLMFLIVMYGFSVLFNRIIRPVPLVLVPPTDYGAGAWPGATNVIPQTGGAAVSTRRG